MKIERPDFKDLLFMGDKTRHWFTFWFNSQIEPVNKMLKEGVEVNGHCHTGTGWTYYLDPLDEYGINLTRKALLINIQPIKKETAEDILRKLISMKKQHPVLSYDLQIDELLERAKAVLGESE